MAQLLADPLGPFALVLLALLLALALFALSRRTRSFKRAVLRIAGSVALVLGLAMLAGASALATSQTALTATRPPQGRLVDVGGYRVFVTCEGPRRGPVIVWLSGGYSNGWYMKPLHDRIRGERRSCLIDRPGTGYADDGPRPRSVDQILREIHAGLAGAGETGPLILAGHSMGGLYAVNYADAYPGQVKALVLLDPTPVRWSVEQIQLMGCGAPDALRPEVAETAFGLGLVRSLNPLWGRGALAEQRAFGTMWPTIVAMESRPRSLVAAWDAGQYACSHGLDLVQTKGALGDLPVLKIVQARPKDPMREAPKGLDPRQQRNWLRMRLDWEREYVDYTSRGTLRYAPEGYDHLFPMLHPDWTLQEIRPFLDTLKTASST